MKNTIAMIPARLGSKRVIKKNLRLINGKPLIGYIIETVMDADIFDDIYINSEAEIFSEIANHYGIKFYKRPEELSSDTATNDEFALDFMNNVPGDTLIQILPTSPLISSSEIKGFVSEMMNGEYDSLISVEHKQIACLYDYRPVNFDKYIINPPSQTMTPVLAYATVLMGWKYDNYKENMKKYHCAYHGGDGRIGYYQLKGLSTVDIDNEEDFMLAERIIKSLQVEDDKIIQYYGNE